ncbi:META domain-containing protein [Corynebacterium comes]|uniref:META domain protein n=1 Tax=Corynebacterium comes TaxID=2675218 RepID=A0A6B8WBA6_9CORY|nr:META domain-containing protein [Corynebacterium comes]QGU04138.1 META domain protein [Corynebacterium comes]
MSLNSVLATILPGAGLTSGSVDLAGQGSSQLPPPPACSPVSGVTGSGPVGVWGCDSEALPKVALKADRTMNGYDGCNWFSGTWREEGARIVFNDDRVSTKRACGHPTWFTQARSATVHGNIMTVHNAAGDSVGALPRR